MKLAIFGRDTRSTDYALLYYFFNYLRQNQISYQVYEPYATALRERQHLSDSPALITPTFDRPHQITDADFLYCIGGDGTLLDAVYFLKNHSKPIVAVNAGRLGFLTSATQSDLIRVTQSLMGNTWRIENRSMIAIDSQPDTIFPDFSMGLNEVSIHKSNSNEMIVVHTYINGEYLNSYWADGLIISTPTGSTAYSMACGGPILLPTSSNFVLTPIAPHSLTVRPIVIPDNLVISFTLESRSGSVMVAVDNRTQLVSANIELAIRKADVSAQLVRFPFRSYFSTLRTRLSWGLDTRN